MRALSLVLPAVVCSLLSAAPPKPQPQPPAPPQAHAWPGQGEPSVEKARRFILDREAGGDYTAEDSKHRWFGGYQFHLKTSNSAAERMDRPDLIDIPANQWTPDEQDAAFYLIYDRGRGRKHWFRHRPHQHHHRHPHA